MTKLHELSPSDITLTPGTDGASDYQQYLEKISRRDSRGKASLVHSVPTGNDEISRCNSSVETPARIIDNETQLGISAISITERTRPTESCKEPERHIRGVQSNEDSHEYPGPLALSLLTIGICMSVFLVSLDRTIVATVRASYDPLYTISSDVTSSSSRPYHASLMISTPLTM